MRQFLSAIAWFIITCVMLGAFAAIMWASIDRRGSSIHATETYGASVFATQQSAHQTAWWRQP